MFPLGFGAKSSNTADGGSIHLHSDQESPEVTTVTFRPNEEVVCRTPFGPLID